MIFKDRFKDKVMILTGAARGIGRTTAIRAAQEGAKMVLADRLAEEGEETLAMIQQPEVSEEQLRFVPRRKGPRWFWRTVWLKRGKRPLR